MAKGGKRTYARDGNGRFASTPGSAAKKAAKSTSGRKSTLGARTGLKGSKAKLRAKDKADQTLQNTLSTRAQKGAVKRGSRKLAAAKTAAQTRISGGRKGVIGKPKGLKAGAPKKATNTFRPGQFKRLKTMQGVSYEKPVKKQAKSGASFRPGEFYRGNFRPRNVTAKPVKGENPFHRFAGKNHAEHNLNAVTRWVESQGVYSRIYSDRKNNRSNIARAWQTGNTIGFNKSSGYWSLPRSEQIRLRRNGWHSSSSPMAVLHHEMGHIKDKRLPFRWQEARNTSRSKAGITRRYNSFEGAADVKLSANQRKRRGKEIKALASRVSRYAQTNPSEFIAETYAGRRTGRKYDNQVMNAYREAKGLPPLRLKGQKPRRRKPKP